MLLLLRMWVLFSNFSRLGSCHLATTREVIKIISQHISVYHSSHPHFPSHDAFVNTYTCASHWHHTGSLEEIPEQEAIQEGELLHLRVNPEGGSGESGLLFELPECPNHYPTTYVKGKPRSIAIPYLCFLNSIC